MSADAAWESELRHIQPQLDRLEKALLEVLPVFPKFFSKTDGEWAYTIPTPAGGKGGFSYSTNAMIACVIGHVLGYSRKPGFTVPAIKPMEALSLEESLRDKLRECWRLAIENLVGKLPAQADAFKDTHPWPNEWPANPPANRVLFSYSSTFGLNDPFSLTWFADLYLQSQICSAIDDPLKLDFLFYNFRTRAQDVADFLWKTFPRHPLCTKTRGASLNHAFPWMRWARLLDAEFRYLQKQADKADPAAPGVVDIEKELKQNRDRRSKVLAHLEAILHRHLSFTAIPDSEYDPPEMVLALEGILVLQRDYDRAVVQRVFKTLAEPEMSRLFWRAHRPMIAHSQGTVLPPISTEIGNSLLRICGMLDAGFAAELFAICQPPLRRYAEWLLSRRVTGRAKPPDGGETCFSGWHSDHVLAADTVHLWMTAHTVLFLHDYLAFMRRHVRRISGFSVATKEECFKELKVEDEKGCKDELERREPLDSVVSSVYSVTKRLREQFIEPWLASAPANYAMLLYGPPGTGKTSLAKGLAGALGWDLVQLSPSDFVRGGEAEVEERAKTVFHALEQLSTAVVLFDEIDRLLLDRDAVAYNKQGDVFQFMTPGMLTKINDLAARKRLIFIISTNFAERIDGAIKRHGRIDQQYLWLPPNAKRRAKLLAFLLRQTLKKNPPDDLDPGPERENEFKELCAKVQNAAEAYFSYATKPESKELISKTTFWIFKEMEKLFEKTSDNELLKTATWTNAFVQALATGDAARLKEVAEVLIENTKNVTPIIRLRNYQNRFRKKNDNKEFLYADEPHEEFLLLLHDALESNYEFKKRDEDEFLKPFAADLKPDLFERVRDEAIRAKLDPKLKEWGYQG